MYAFGGGRRICAGEVLARNRLFLFVACLLQKFEFLPPGGDCEKPQHDPRTFQPGLVLRPQFYKMIAKPRS